MKHKILKCAGIILLLLGTAVFASPYLFKGKISGLIKARVAKDLKAHVNFSGVDISLFRHFPKITLGINNPQVISVGEFEGDTLMTAKKLDIICSIKSILSGDSIKVYALDAYEPRIHAIVHKDGQNNWDILKSSDDPREYSASSTRSVKWLIQWYSIHDGYINYQDEIKTTQIEINNLEHTGRGNFAADIFTLKTNTSADAIHFNFHGAIPYQVTAKTNIDVSFRVNQKTHTYSFKTDQVSFNDLKLHTDGLFQWINDSSYTMNIKFNALSTEFKNILSMLPSVYQKDFASIQSRGNVLFNGFIKGKYDDKHFPAYHINLDIKNGFFKYPDLPMPVEKINLAFQLDNPDGAPDHAILNVPHGLIEINNDLLDFHLLVKNPKTKPFIDMSLTGKLDLSNISKLIKLEPGTHLNGVLNTDVYARGTLPETEKRKRTQFNAGGSFELSDFSYASKTDPAGISLNTLSMLFNSKNVLIPELKGQYLGSRFDATGSVNNLFSFALQDKALNGSFDTKIDELNLRNWIRSDRDSPTQNVSPYIVPNYIDFVIKANADNLHYDNLDMKNLSGKLIISEETIKFDHVVADALEGSIVIDGTYSTWQSRENPEISFHYNVNGLDVQKTFFAFNTLQKIMPIAKFVSGKFNSQMSLKASLGKDMTPDLQSLHGEGNLILVEGSMKDFGPLDKLSQLLDISELKEVPLKDIKTDFEYSSGKVIVAPFTVRTKDIEMDIDGTHGYEQSLDYEVGLKVPRTELGAKGKAFVKNIVMQAADKGIPVKIKDAVNINVKMVGTINNPDINTDMNSVVDHAASDLKNEVNDFVNAKLDSAKQELNSSPASAKKPPIVQTSYKSKANTRSKKSQKSGHKNTSHKKTKKKQKTTRKYYSNSAKKDRSTASK
ncbi:MAG TPA: AsmA-like C-terminal region-containing protein [Puia sp.]|nr:AsmA-like C-terminal region-containing protein [Puia sp.]